MNDKTSEIPKNEKPRIWFLAPKSTTPHVWRKTGNHVPLDIYRMANPGYVFKEFPQGVDPNEGPALETM